MLIFALFTAHLDKNGQKETLNYINELGGSPLTAGNAWNESNFNLDKWLNADPVFTSRVLFDHEFLRCPAGYAEKLCLKFGSKIKNETIYFYGDFLKNDTEYIMEQLRLDKSLKAEAVENFIEFLMLKEEIKKRSISDEFVESKEKIKISDLQNKFPDIDWFKVINKQLLKHSRVTEDEAVLIEHPRVFKRLFQNAIEFNQT